MSSAPSSETGKSIEGFAWSVNRTGSWAGMGLNRQKNKESVLRPIGEGFLVKIRIEMGESGGQI